MSDWFYSKMLLWAMLIILVTILIAVIGINFILSSTKNECGTDACYYSNYTKFSEWADSYYGHGNWYVSKTECDTPNNIFCQGIFYREGVKLYTATKRGINAT